MNVAISMIILNTGNYKLSIDDIIIFYKRHYPNDTISEGANDDGIITYKVNGCDVFLAPVMAPIPWSDLEGPCNTSMLWSDSIEPVKKHKSHIIVTVTTPLGIKYDVANSVLSMATASTSGIISDCIGVYWCNSRSVVRKDVFVDFMTNIFPEGPPMPIWIDIRAGTQPNGTTAGFTTGLAAFGLMEIETLNAPMKTSELRERMWEIAGYLMNNGQVIKDGDTVGESATDETQVQYVKSNFGIKDKVMRLMYVKK